MSTRQAPFLADPCRLFIKTWSLLFRGFFLRLAALRAGGKSPGALD
jgi:hypothetical protein